MSLVMRVIRDLLEILIISIIDYWFIANPLIANPAIITIIFGNFAGPLLVVGGRRRGARRDALAAGLAAGNEAVGLVVAAGAP